MAQAGKRKRHVNCVKSEEDSSTRAGRAYGCPALDLELKNAKKLQKKLPTQACFVAWRLATPANAGMAISAKEHGRPARVRRDVVNRRGASVEVVGHVVRHVDNLITPLVDLEHTFCLMCILVFSFSYLFHFFGAHICYRKQCREAPRDNSGFDSFSVRLVFVSCRPFRI